MKCPKCGGGRLKKYRPSPLAWDVRHGHGNIPCPEFLTYCFTCCIGWREVDMDKTLLEGVKPRGKSAAASVIR